jgi:acetoin:2,6-dichlorophenolindophenol oxidoreductase subunit beta
MTEMTYSEAINSALREEMRRDPTVFLIGEDIAKHGGAFGVTRGIYDEFGTQRVINTPISEAAITAAAVGAGLVGTRPVMEIMYMDFITIAMSQIVNQMAKMRYMFGGKTNVPVVVRTPSGGGRGNAAQHMQSLEAWFVHVPGVKVVMPATPYDAKGLLKSAIRDDDPVIFVEHKLLYSTKGEVPAKEYLIPFGKAEIKRTGNDVTLIATSRMLLFAMAAANQLAEESVDVEVIDPRTLVPLDMDTILNSVKKTGRVVIVHEAVERCGVGAEIAAQIQEKAFDFLDAPILRVANPNVPIPFARNIEALSIPDEARIVHAVKCSLGITSEEILLTETSLNQ